MDAGKGKFESFPMKLKKLYLSACLRTDYISRLQAVVEDEMLHSSCLYSGVEPNIVD